MPKKITTQVGIAGNFTSRQIEIGDNDPTPWGPDYKATLVGTDVRRIDGVAKVTGKAKYSYDINLPGMLWGKILRSPHPAAPRMGRWRVGTHRRESGPVASSFGVAG